jgi:hypothetical protein
MLGFNRRFLSLLVLIIKLNTVHSYRTGKYSEVTVINGGGTYPPTMTPSLGGRTYLCPYEWQCSFAVYNAQWSTVRCWWHVWGPSYHINNQKSKTALQNLKRWQLALGVTPWKESQAFYSLLDLALSFTPKWNSLYSSTPYWSMRCYDLRKSGIPHNWGIFNYFLLLVIAHFPFQWPSVVGRWPQFASALATNNGGIRGC